MECSEILRYAADGVMRSDGISAKIGTRFGAFGLPADFSMISRTACREGSNFSWLIVSFPAALSHTLFDLPLWQYSQYLKANGLIMKKDSCLRASNASIWLASSMGSQC